MHENLDSAVLLAIPGLCCPVSEHQTSARHRCPVKQGLLLPHASQRSDVPTVLVWNKIQRGPYIGHTAVGGRSRMQTQATKQVQCGTRPPGHLRPSFQALNLPSVCHLPGSSTMQPVGGAVVTDRTVFGGEWGGEEGM